MGSFRNRKPYGLNRRLMKREMHGVDKKTFLFCIAALLLSGCTSDGPDGGSGRGKPDSYRIVMTWAPSAGTKIALGISADEADRKDVWIDLNGNGEKEEGEEVTDFQEEENVASATSIGNRNIQKRYTSTSSTITIYGKINGLNCIGNKIIQLDVSRNRMLQYLSCADNPLNHIDVRNNSALKVLHCGSTDIRELNLTQNKKLEKLDCSFCELMKLNVTRNTELVRLDCSINELTELDLSRNKKLSELDCSENRLHQIDVGSCPKLFAINCSENNLQSLILSRNKSVYFISCSMNNISGKRMDALIESLPKREKDAFTSFCVIDRNGVDGRPDMNICTRKQVEKARAKHWEVLAAQGDRHVIYDGS